MNNIFLIVFVSIFLGCNRTPTTTQPAIEATTVANSSSANEDLDCTQKYTIQNTEGEYSIKIAGECQVGNTLKLQEKKDALDNLKESIIGLAMGASGESYYGFEQVLVNNKPYTGTIIGYDKQTGKNKIVELTLKNGLRDGDLKIWEGTMLELHYKYKDNERTEVVRFRKPRPDKKPIIYLYPERKITVQVALDYLGELTTTYPKYTPQKGWIVEASPDGTLVDTKNQKEYYGLYWEGQSNWVYDLSTGFVVKGEEAAIFLDEKLAQLGLNRREANEFIVYWLPQLEQNKYNLIHFAQKDYQNLAKLNISPKPTTLIRVFMVFQALEQPIDIVEQKLPTIERKGFTVVEWGGKQSIKSNTHE